MEKVEKGERIQAGDVVYGRFWNKEWTGKGDPEPHASGHAGPAKGATVRAYLAQRNGVGDYWIVCGNRNGDRPTEFSCGTDKGGEFFIVLKKE